MPEYGPAVRSRFLAPRFAGTLAAEARVRSGRAADGAGAELELMLRLNDEAATDDTRIERAAFRARACPSCIAAADWACEWLRGRTLAEARGLKAQALESVLGLVPEKRHCGLLVEDALAAALKRPTDQFSDTGAVD